MTKLIAFLMALRTAFCSCQPEIRQSGFGAGRSFYKTQKNGRLPSVVNESSGLVKVPKMLNYWTLNDGGGQNVLYRIDSAGRLIETRTIPNATNTDWEDLTTDTAGSLYIGDFGNNLNNRKDLKIYKINHQSADNVEVISFSFGDQKDFPPSKKNQNFDCEAMFCLGDSLYLISKNRGKKYVKLYALPARAGTYEAIPKDSIKLKTMVTGAAINPETSEFVLLSYGKLFFFDIKNQQINFRNPKRCKRFPHGQSEAITYTNNRKLLITNEEGRIFEVVQKR
jgi:hypothetical protein